MIGHYFDSFLFGARELWRAPLGCSGKFRPLNRKRERADRAADKRRKIKQRKKSRRRNRRK